GLHEHAALYEDIPVSIEIHVVIAVVTAITILAGPSVAIEVAVHELRADGAVEIDAVDIVVGVHAGTDEATPCEYDVADGFTARLQIDQAKLLALVEEVAILERDVLEVHADARELAFDRA